MKKSFLKYILVLLTFCILFSSVGCGGDTSVDTNGGEEKPPVGITYTITFDSQGGTDIPQQTVSEGGRAVKPTDPEKISSDTDIEYEFEEWRLNGVAFDFNSVITEDITLVAYYAVYGSIV